MKIDRRPVRIANFSGFYGDRLSALEEMVNGGPVDVVTGDYLAEVTMLVLARARRSDSEGGYAATFLRQIEPVANEIADRHIKVVVNAGGLNPAAMARATSDLLGELGVGLSVARVEGDDLMPHLSNLISNGHELRNLDTGMPFDTWNHEPLTANAYLGGFGIKSALDGGADIVVTGRVADASLVSGVAAWWWDWGREDYDALAGAVLAGHVIECGAQATGGNFSGFREISDLVKPGFPIAEIHSDGRSLVTKHPGTGGEVTVDTVTAQLLYEVADPMYLNPDVVAAIDSVHLEQVATDEVLMSGAKGLVPPRHTKVAVTALGGWRNTSTVVLTGLDVDAKAAVFEASVRAQLGEDHGISDLRFTRIGTVDPDASDQMTGSCLLQISADGDEGSCGRRFSSALVELALANFPGLYFTEPPGRGSAFGVYWPTLIDQESVDHVVVHESGRRESIPAPKTFALSASLPIPEADASYGTEPAEQSRGIGPSRGKGPSRGNGAKSVEPLGRLLNARSGDKGGNANLGVWATDDAVWSWLRATITVETLRSLLPEIRELAVERFEFANLRAVNFVIHSLLNGGATEARRFDKQAKALGEWFRARKYPVPKMLVADD
ncbi:MAG TPA: acyclic terpene utilization AtuA family protein [Acidimicrobiales bacterium]|nr:acyclic terpene utilization AtuA family protein [Acidimicrobiales bacterium]